MINGINKVFISPTPDYEPYINSKILSDHFLRHNIMDLFYNMFPYLKDTVKFKNCPEFIFCKKEEIPIPDNFHWEKICPGSISIKRVQRKQNRKQYRKNNKSEHNKKKIEREEISKLRKLLIKEHELEIKLKLKIIIEIKKMNLKL